MTEISVLDHGFVRLDACMASDLSVVNAARVSMNKRSTYASGCSETCPGGEDCTSEHELREEDAGLIRFLLTNRHGTPFEHNALRFHVKCPIFVAREWMRHRIGSFNEWSGRYSKLAPEFYVPDNMRSQIGKPGAYTFEPVPDDIANYARNQIRSVNVEAWAAYESMLEDGIAKEVARLTLPVNIYTQFYWTVNARSLMNFLSLRNAETAMFEIRQYAQAVEHFFSYEMPETHDVFVKNGRVAP